MDEKEQAKIVLVRENTQEKGEQEETVGYQWGEFRKEWASTREPDPYPDITTAEERQAEEEARKQIAKDVAEFNDQMLRMALTGKIGEQVVTRAEGDGVTLVLPEPAAENLPDEEQNIIELPEPVVHPLSEPRWKKRCDAQWAKARYKTNAQKRKEKAQKRKTRAK